MGDHRQEYPFLERNALSKIQHMPIQPLSQDLLGKENKRISRLSPFLTGCEGWN